MKEDNTVLADFMASSLMMDTDGAWCILGTNRSGISSFFNCLVENKDRLCRETGHAFEKAGVVSFQDQQAIYEAERNKDQTDILDRIDPGTPAKDFLHDRDSWWELITALSMDRHLDKGYRQLSTGQSRKLMLLARITAGCKTLIIETPYDGLDAKSCQELDKAFAILHQNGVTLWVFVYDPSDIPQWCSHIGVIQDNVLAFSGVREDMLPRINSLACDQPADFQAAADDVGQPGSANLEGNPVKTDLVRLNNGSAGYGGKDVFKDLTLHICQGDHTLVKGPNGCGKSTLLQLVTGDHPACYTNDLKMFGRVRGSGETIWEIKHKMGIFSPDLHRNWLVPGTVFHCILSGFFDSIGLYQPCSGFQKMQAVKWLERIGLEDKKDAPFRSLSHSDQRLALIARAVIKAPQLLVLDEPTQGLDYANRHALLDFLEQIATEEISTILYVSHREDEFRSFFVQTIDMGSTK